MDYHDILMPTLQKYFSALSSLDEVGQSGDFFDDVSNLDKFFSEFRNITFVLQKVLGTKENKGIYARLRAEYLSSDTLKWFVDVRNKTTKEKPFDLQKELAIDLYLPTGTITLIDTRLVMNMDDSFDNALNYIRSVFFEKYRLIEISFTVRIVFREAGNEVDIYSKIKAGIAQMSKFVTALQRQFPCSCEVCNELKRRIDVLTTKALSKELLFTRDYTLEVGKEPQLGETGETYISLNNGEQTSFSALRLPMNDPIFGEYNGCLKSIFIRFALLHTFCYVEQREIMPVFMVVYNDQTYRLIPFIAASRATFYRKAQEVVELPDFNEANAVFYCGEYYCYDMEQFPEIITKPRSERITTAQREVLSFALIAKENYEISISLDESKIDDPKYVENQFKEIDFEKVEAPSFFDWLGVIRSKLNEHSSLPN